MNEELKKELEGIAKEAETKLKSLQEEIVEAKKDKASAQELETLKLKYDENVETTNKLATEVDKLKNTAPKTKALSFEEEVSKGLNENADKIKRIANGSDERVRFKAATTISTSNFGIGVLRGFREPEIGKIPYSDRFIFDLISVMNGGPGSFPMSWINRVPKEGAAAFVAESAVKPQMDWNYVEEEINSRTIAVWVAITKQSLLNMPMLNQEINDELLRNLYAVLDSYVLRLGTGVAPLINSMWQYAKAFTGGIHLGKIPTANIYDVLRIAIEQVNIGDITSSLYTGFTPNAIFLSPSNVTNLDLEKDLNGNYILPPFTSQENNVVKGVKVYPTKHLSDEEFLVGDTKRYLFNILEGIDVSIGLINDQFVRNQFTIRAELQGNGRVKAHDTYAFVKGDIPTAITLIKKP